ncbi:hypothetical protein KM043_005028 [Ampulex compressa]|nr:hypothetical protein KM043_005028 [Ampulex compressa]
MPIKLTRGGWFLDYLNSHYRGGSRLRGPLILRLYGRCWWLTRRVHDIRVNVFPPLLLAIVDETESTPPPLCVVAKPFSRKDREIARFR